MEIQEHVALAPWTTLGIGGPARWFVTAACEEDVRNAVAFAQERNAPLFVLGGGSNLLIADAGYQGLVMHMAIPGTERRERGDGKELLAVGAGENWDQLVQFSVERNLAGMECLAGIPGTVGGTPVQNVGAYGQDVSETIDRVRCFDTQTSEFIDLSNSDCGFAYRTSLLNTTERGRYLVTRVDFALTPDSAPRLEYADLRKHFSRAESPTLQQTAEAVRQIRRIKSMVIDPEDPNTRSAGSFFRNPLVAEDQLQAIAAAAGVAMNEVPRWPAGTGQVKLAAAWLLETAGFVRGYTMGKRRHLDKAYACAGQSRQRLCTGNLRVT